MLLRLLRENFWRRRERVAVAIVAIIISSALATALFAIYADIMDRMSQELRSYGANIMVTPRLDALEIDIAGASYSPVDQPSLLQERDLARIKTVFWRNNIVGFAPFLSLEATVGAGSDQAVVTGTWFDREIVIPKGTPVRSSFAAPAAVSSDTSFRTGIRKVSPWWRTISGSWPDDNAQDEALLGQAFARRSGMSVGDSVEIKYGGASKPLRVVGILESGGPEDDQIVVPMAIVQELAASPGAVGRVLVSALTLPKEKLAADIRNKRPEEMTPQEYEKWYCSPTIDSIITQVKEVLPGSEANAIRQVSEAEGSFLVRIQWLMLLVALVALAASALAVMTAMTASVTERHGEIGLIKALGAMDSQVATIFLAEAGALGLIGGAMGFGFGALLSNFMGSQVFGIAIWPHPAIAAVSVFLGLAVAVAGSAIPVRQAIGVEPVILLRQG